jgi:hypothetical protein
MLDLLEDRGGPADWAHVAACPECRARLEDAKSGAELASRTEVPEPPGLYWEALRRNVSRRIAEEPEKASPWGWIVPLAAAAAAVLVIGISLVDRAPAPGGAAMTLPAWTALPPVDQDEGLLVVSGFAADEALDWELEEGQGLGAFVASLSEDESEALVEALRAEGPEGEW